MQLQIVQGKQKHNLTVKAGQNLLEVLHKNDMVITAPCGGHGTCGKCIVSTHKGDLLACKTEIDIGFSGTKVRIPAVNNMKILAAYESTHTVICDRHCSPTPSYGIAIDIGTTTLAFELLKMDNGERIVTHSAENSQREFGADVMSRITNAVAGAKSELHAYIIRDICNGVRHILEHTEVDVTDVSLITITGNTTMLHLLLNQPCDSLGVAPFTPVFIDMITMDFNEIFDDDLLGCKVIILPGISTFVGADITAGMLCAGWPNITGSNLLIDLGTNGEMALFSSEKIFVTSTAAGPAFEGGNISMGIGSVDGAIAKVFLKNVNSSKDSYVFNYETINDLEPIGICGTGVVDISAELIRHGFIDETGFLEVEDPVCIAPNIYFTQRDVREIQLAKSAVRSGIEILLDIAGVKYEELSNVFVAGGFGYKIDIKNAITLGIIPLELEDKIIILGNSALGGCANVLLSTTSEADIEKLCNMATEINLAAHPRFNDLFMEYMSME